MPKVETLITEVQQAAKSRGHQLACFKKTSEPMLLNVSAALA